jgi:hypothetical protein
MLRKFKVTYRAVRKEGTMEIDAFSKYDAKRDSSAHIPSMRSSALRRWWNDTFIALP